MSEAQVAGAVSQSNQLFRPGELVDGRYRVDAYLRGGGMALVYRATHLVLGRPVALKVLSMAMRDVPGVAARFLREARAATHLRSAHVVRVFDVGMLPSGAPYMAMDFLEGRDLGELLERGFRPSVAEAVTYVLQACEALAEVHGLGIVHRDLKPGNLFLTRGADGLPSVTLIDFGISRSAAPLSRSDVVNLTQPEMMLGSPRYMPPEQMESAARADARSDIWGLGAVFYELLTGRPAFDGESIWEIYSAAVQGPPPSPSKRRRDLPAELSAAVVACLRAKPAERFVDVAELAAAIAPFGPPGARAYAASIARVLESARARSQEGAAFDDPVPLSDDPSRTTSGTALVSGANARRRRRAAAIVMTLVALASTAIALDLSHVLAARARPMPRSSGPSGDVRPAPPAPRGSGPREEALSPSPSALPVAPPPSSSPGAPNLRPPALARLRAASAEPTRSASTPALDHALSAVPTVPPVEGERTDVTVAADTSAAPAPTEPDEGQLFEDRK